MKGSLWEIAALIVVVAVVLQAANIAYGNQSTATTVENESHVIDFENTTHVDREAAVYDDSITVTRNVSDGGTSRTFEAGEDYEWRPNFGEIEWRNTANTTDGEPVNVTYTFHEADETTDGVATILGSAGWLVGIIVMLTIIGGVFAFAFGGDGF